jgi:hypothetical protein
MWWDEKRIDQHLECPRPSSMSQDAERKQTGRQTREKNEEMTTKEERKDEPMNLAEEEGITIVSFHHLIVHRRQQNKQNLRTKRRSNISIRGVLRPRD